MNEELMTAEQSEIMIRKPAAILAEAKEAAQELQKIVSGKPDKVIINNQQYLEFEDWQTVGKFYGITIKVISTMFIEIGGAHGYEARAVALNRQGLEISAAEAMCLNDEEKWSTRTKYSYVYILKDGSKVEEDPPKDQIIWEANPDKPGKNRPKKERIKVGDIPVPLFQLRSMAQTRACAKALRNVLAWVVVLAGYKPTPAEEMDGIGERKESEKKETEKPPLQEPQKKESNGGDQPNIPTAKISIKSVSIKEKKADGTSMKNPCYILISDSDVEYRTFDKKLYDLAMKERGTGMIFSVEYEKSQYGLNLKKMEQEDIPF